MTFLRPRSQKASSVLRAAELARATPHPSQGILLACFLTAELDGPLGAGESPPRTKAWSVCQGMQCVFSPLPCGSGHQVDYTLGFPEPQKESAGP